MKVRRERKNQQDATIRCLLSTSVSTCFGHHYAHLQENKDRVTAYGVLRWFCWMWLVAVVGRCVVGCEQCSHPTTQSHTTTIVGIRRLKFKRSRTATTTDNTQDDTQKILIFWNPKACHRQSRWSMCETDAYKQQHTLSMCHLSQDQPSLVVTACKNVLHVYNNLNELNMFPAMQLPYFPHKSRSIYDINGSNTPFNPR